MRFKNSLYLTAFAAHLPMLLIYANNTWKKGLYQFFPLLVGAVAWLIYDRLSSVESKRAGDSGRLVAVLLCVDMVMLTASALVFSPFLIIQATMILIAAYVIDRYGWAAFKRVFPAWLLLLLIVPIPLNLDFKLIQSMQFLASQLASWILDAVGQVHFAEGVVLVTEKKQFFADEACSGIRSLFSSVAVMALYGVIRNYPLWRHLFNLAQTIFWVIYGNAIRVALVVYISDHWTDAIASGTNHEMLGIGMFVLIFVHALITDRAVEGLISRKENEIWEEESVSVTADVSPKAGQTKQSAALNGAFLVVFCLVFLFSVRLAYAKSSFQVDAFGEQDLYTIRQTDLPSDIDGWSCVEFQHKVREDASLLAPESFIWKLRKNNREVSISLDSPYPEFHDLTLCYRGLGWQTKTEISYSTSDRDVTAPQFSTIVMAKQEQIGLVYFAGFARDGSPVVPLSRISVAARTSEIIRNVKTVFGVEDQSREYRRFLPRHLQPVSQIQLLRIANSEVSDAEKKELAQLFVGVRDILLTSPRFSME